MNKSLIKFWDKIIVALLTATGMFTGCKSDCETYYSGTEYGILPATYEIKGTVKSKAYSEPIPNIRIIKTVYENFGDTLYTNSKGEYLFRFANRHFSGKSTFRLILEDIDGEDNGGYFATKEIEVKIGKSNQIKKCKNEKYVKIENIKLERINNGIVVMYGVQQASFKK